MSAGHGAGHGDHGGNKGVALLISVLALILAFSETLGKNAQTAALASNIEASNLWAFFQAKTIRQTVLRTAAEELETAPLNEAAKKQVAKWKETARRYQSEPETGEGREQIAIVLASASIIAAVAALAWIAGALGVIAVAFCVIGIFFPTAVHLF